MQIKTDAIVLRTLKYGDTKIIVDFLTERLGRVSFICRVPRTKKARVKIPYFQPLNILSIEFNYRPKSSLQHLTDIQVGTPYGSIPFDAVKSSVCLFLAEFLVHATRDEQENRPLFEFVRDSLEWFDNAREGIANFHLVFMMRLSRFLGFFPNTDDYQEGDCFDLRNGRFSSSIPLHTDVVLPDEAAKVRLLMRMNFDNLHLFSFSRVERSRCLEIILQFYRIHVPDFPELNAMGVLKEVFNA